MKYCCVKHCKNTYSLYLKYSSLAASNMNLSKPPVFKPLLSDLAFDFA